jgi:hypothetical protein
MARQLERCIPTPYVLHKKKSVSDVCENGYVEYIYPKNELKAPSLEFEIKGDSEHLIVPSNIYLKIALELVTTGRKTVVKEDEEGAKRLDYHNVGVVNNIFYSLFESEKVEVSQETITKTDRNTPYKALFTLLCNYGKEQHETYLQLVGFSKDSPEYMEKCTDANTGWANRKALFTSTGSSRRIELIGKIMSPLFFQSKVLPTQVPLQITLDKKPSRFYMMYEDDNYTYDLEVKEAYLMVQKVAVVPGLKQSYIDLLEEDQPIPYYMSSPLVTHYSIERNTTDFVKDDLFQGRLPSKVLFAMVETEACHGRDDRNPFNFKDFGLIEICMYKDGIPYPRPLIRMDLSQGKYTEAYHHFMSALNANYTRVTPNITPHDYKNGYFMIAYNMSPDQMGSVHPSTLMNASSNVRLEMKFKEPVEKNITLLVYYELPMLMELQRDRRVTIES